MPSIGLSAQLSSANIAAGGTHSLALTAGGTLWAWGGNEYGQLGDGTTVNQSTPINMGEGFTTIITGGYHSLALKTDGSLWAWGANYYGQLGYSGTTDQPVPVEIDDGFTDISAGGDHTLGLKTDGSLWAWGSNWYGQLGIGDETSTVRSTPVLVGTGYSAIAAGGEHSLALKTDGSLWAWGYNASGQLGNGSTDDQYSPVSIGTDFAAISAGSEHSLALKTDGSLWTWGYNSGGQLGDGTTVQSLRPIEVGDGFTAIAAGGWHSLGLKTDGTLWAWGENYWGQLGDGTWTDSATPVQIGSGFSFIASGAAHSLGLKTDGSLWAWGRNERGQLGNGNTTNQPSPVQVDLEIESPGYVYYVPYLPDIEEFSLGFGVSNIDHSSAANVTVEYFNNSGQSLGQDIATIPASGHYSFMSGISPAESGWVRITASQALYGMALAFGSGEDPMFDMDFKDSKATNLTAAHVDTGGGWISKAMLANPNESQAQVNVTFYPSSGGATQTANLSIPALGSVQYDLSVFEDIAGSVKFASDQGLVGFLLYDGRVRGYNWTGGLSIVPSSQQAREATNSSAITTAVPFDNPAREGEYVYYVPYSPNIEDFSLGFGVSNVDNGSPADVYVDYFNNSGVNLGQDVATIPAYAHTAFMNGISPTESGWARITATQPLYGMALVFGYEEDPMFDMDFKDSTATDLTAAHVDTGGGWISKAMLANPNDSQAQVSVTFHLSSGTATKSASLSIPAMGAVQYDLSEFGEMAGSIKIASDKGLVGFLLYDGRLRNFNWAGGLSIVPSY